MKKILTEPLVHFLVIGALLFIGFSLAQDGDQTMANKIVVTENDITVLKADFERTWQRPPQEKELKGLLEEKIREEIAYREGLELGLDRDDPYIRRRLRMKLELMLEDISAQSTPTEEELATFLTENREMFRRQPRIGFSQVYLNPASHGDQLEREAEKLRERLSREEGPLNLELFGDAIMLPRKFPLSPTTVISRQFGKMFVDQLDKVEVGEWQGPIRSGYGYHLVFVEERIEGRDPELAEIRPAVEREYDLKLRKELKEKIYSGLREKYTIVIEHESAPDA